MRNLIRRIRKSEYEELKKFIVSENVEIPPFEKHENWLQKVYKELEGNENSRIIFGSFAPTAYREKNLLQGCLFIKRSFFYNTVELKSIICANENFILREKYYYGIDKNDSREKLLIKKREIKSELIEKAIKFCQTREFPKIEIELLQLEMMEDITLLLNHGFVVSSIRQRANKYVCVLEKNIGNVYLADPLDEKKVIGWLVHTLFRCHIDDGIVIDNETNLLNADILSFKFNMSKNLENGSNLNFPKWYEKYDIIGQLLKIDEIEGEYTFLDVINIFNKKSLIKYIYSNEIDSQMTEKLLENNIFCLNYSQVREIAGGEKSSFNPNIVGEDIKGVLTVLEEEKINELEGLEKFVYFLVSGIGSILETNSSSDDFLVFYSPNIKKNSDDGIVGYAKILESSLVSIRNAYDIFSEKGLFKALSEDDLRSYEKNGFPNDEIRVLLCSKFIELNNPISIGQIEDSKIRDFLKQELYDNLLSSVYLNETIINFIREQDAKQDIKQEDIQKSIFISYDRNNEEIINLSKNLSKILSKKFKVFFDEHLSPAKKYTEFMDNIAKADYVIFMIDNNYLNDIETIGRGVQYEWNTYLKNSKENPQQKKIPIVVQIDTENLPRVFDGYSSIKHKLGQSQEELFKNISAALK